MTGFVTQAAAGLITEAWTYNDYGEVETLHGLGRRRRPGRVELRAGRPRPHRREDRDDARRHPCARVRIRPRGSARGGLRGRPPRRELRLRRQRQPPLEPQRRRRLRRDLRRSGPILEYGDEVFTWTDNGELLASTDTATGDTTTYAYDALGNLRGVGLPNGDLVEYLVDGRGRRVGKRSTACSSAGGSGAASCSPSRSSTARATWSRGLSTPAASTCRR
ncbi:MAG: hypothetical protein IPG04_17620 [Polyangiaceae bacterium]|nr:hypothetical protein [Polyangiaceae bacterium]